MVSSLMRCRKFRRWRHILVWATNVA